MTPEEFINKHYSVQEAASYSLDSAFIRELLNRYANHRVDEYEKKRLADLQDQLAEMIS